MSKLYSALVYICLSILTMAGTSFAVENADSRNCEFAVARFGKTEFKTQGSPKQGRVAVFSYLVINKRALKGYRFIRAGMFVDYIEHQGLKAFPGQRQWVYSDEIDHRGGVSLSLDINSSKMISPDMPIVKFSRRINHFAYFIEVIKNDRPVRLWIKNDRHQRNFHFDETWSNMPIQHFNVPIKPRYLKKYRLVALSSSSPVYTRYKKCKLISNQFRP